MKQIILKYAAGLSLFLLLGALTYTPSTKAAGEHRPQKRETVILWSAQCGYSDDTGYHYQGALVYASSSSEGAPQFPQATIPAPVGEHLTETGEAIATLLSSGFRLERTSDYGDYFLFVK